MENQNEHERKEKAITVTVNGKPVAFTEHQVTGRQIKEAADVPLDDDLETKKEGDREVVKNDETITITDGEHFVVLQPHIKVSVHYIAASKPFKTDAEPVTTIGQIKVEALKAFSLTEDTSKVYKLYHNKTELSNLSQTVGGIAGREKALNLKLEEMLVQGV